MYGTLLSKWVIKQNLASKIGKNHPPFSIWTLNEVVFCPWEDTALKAIMSPPLAHLLHSGHERSWQLVMLISYLQVSQHWVIFNAREKHPHGVGSVIEERDPSSIQVACQLMNIRLQLRKGWHKKRNKACINDSPALPHHNGKGLQTHWMRLGYKCRSNRCRGRRWTRTGSPFPPHNLSSGPYPKAPSGHWVNQCR